MECHSTNCFIDTHKPQTVAQPPTHKYSVHTCDKTRWKLNRIYKSAQTGHIV